MSFLPSFESKENLLWKIFWLDGQTAEFINMWGADKEKRMFAKYETAVSWKFRLVFKVHSFLTTTSLNQVILIRLELSN